MKATIMLIAVFSYLTVGATLGIINPGGGTVTETIITPPRIVSAPILAPERLEGVGATVVVEVPTVVQVTQTFGDFLDEQFAEANGPALLDMVAAGEAGEAARRLYVPTLTDATFGFTAQETAVRWVSPAEFELLLKVAGWPEEEWPQAYRVARCESPASLSDGPFGWLDILAVGPGFERGLFQIHPVWFAPEAAVAAGMNRALFEDFDLFDPFHNMLAALTLWRNGGWSHWECFNQGKA